MLWRLGSPYFGHHSSFSGLGIAGEDLGHQVGSAEQADLSVGFDNQLSISGA
jgi:hypothetical protein